VTEKCIFVILLRNSLGSPT